MDDNENLEIENENLEIENNNPEIEETEEDPDLERAKKLGYKDDSEYKGNPKYKLSPKEYLERAEKGGTIKKLESDITEMRDAFEKMQQFTQLQIQSAKTRALEELRAKQIKAIDDGDVTTSEAFEAYEKKKTEVEREYNPAPVQVNKRPRDVEDWIASNPWAIGKDSVGYTARGYETDIINERPDLRNNPVAILEEVKKRIVGEFPEKFENPKKRIQSIEGGGTVHSNSAKKDTFQSIGFSSVDIADAQKLIKSGIYKDEADFIKSYVMLTKGKK